MKAGITKLINHFKIWNFWRKGNLNSPLHKLYILFGGYSPSFELCKFGYEYNIKEFIQAGWEQEEQENDI